MKSSALLAADQTGSWSLTESAPAVGHGIVSRTLLATPELRVVLFTFAAGQALTEHTSTSRALLQVVNGEGEFVAGGETRVLKAGGLLHLPPCMPHAVTARTEMAMLLTLAPERKSGAAV
ncbi:MAG: cupin domain-containing protein [Opitutaceae bacterium]